MTSGALSLTFYSELKRYSVVFEHLLSKPILQDLLHLKHSLFGFGS
jgi:hypothetical protein